MSHPRSFRRKIAAIALTLLAGFGTVGVPLLTPLAARAQVTIVGNVPDDIMRVLDQILTQLVRAGTVALVNAAQTFLGQLAYDAANYVATGGKGQGPLTSAKSPGDYFAQVGEDALGSAIGSLSDEFFESSLGFDLCSPPDPRNLLNIQVSLGGLVPSSPGAFSRPRPSCDFQQVVRNYDQFFTTLSSQDLLRNINANFNPSGNELGATLQIFGRSVGKVGLDTKKAAEERDETGAFKNVTDIVSGNVRTPASLVSESTKQQLIEGPATDEGARRNAILGSAAEQGPIQLVTYTASMFINTLGSKLMGRIMEKGLIGAFDFSDLEQQTQISSADPDALPSRSRADARRANLSLKDVNLIRQSNVEIVSELIACPDVRGTWNCSMDQQMAQAITGNACDGGSCTIAKSISAGLLKGDWKLYPDQLVRQNQDPQCYTYGFCAGNLRKLRLMRILPVGFEFAANSDANIARCASATGCATLREVMDNFTNCNPAGQRDDEHPWCKLIDPNWVLTSFPQQCRLTGYGDQLISERLGQRAEECRDIQTCLKRNDKGECVGGYGYCVAEKTVYRFKGDECPAQAASCRNFTSRGGAAVSYLRSTLDYGQCSSDNAGCLGYASVRRGDGVWVTAATSTIYFDRTLEPCSAADEGCTRLLAAEVGGSALNILSNPSFEAQTSDFRVVNWQAVPAGPTVAGASAANGSRSVEVVSGSELFQTVPVGPARVLTLSAYVRVRASGEDPVFRISTRQFNSAGGVIAAGVINTLFKSPACIASSSDPALGRDAGDTATFGVDWRRFECSFLTSNETSSVEVRLSGRNTLVDAVQLEDGQFATNFLDGSNMSLPVVHMKVAPDEFACTGAATDPAVCGKFAKSCRQVDAGCQGYNDGTGAPEVPAILSSNDLCPAACVGYAEYRKQPSAFDLVVDATPTFSDPGDDGKAYFIPSTARSCRQEEVGCETLTNLEAAAEGGEQTSSYSYLRLCEKPDASLSQTYFTWEGSESAGYQLRTWSLISQSGEGSGPKIVARRGPDGAFKDPASCNEPLWRTGLDADCRQFYDRAGNVFYTYYSQTVLSSNDCKPFRLGRRLSTDDCTKTGGTYNSATGECSYNALPTESRTCSPAAAGCRAYAGAGAGNVFVAVNENFRAGRGAFTAGTPSPESLLVGDQSLRMPPVGGTALTTAVSFGTSASDLYRVSFWAKSSGVGSRLALQMRDGSNPGSTPVAVGDAALSGDWQRFSFGLFNGYAGASTSSLSWTLSGGASPVAFIDEIRVERVRDTSYVVTDSWNTPAMCDQTFSGVPEPQAMLGCKQYTDRFRNTVTASQFTRLCRDEAIGCRAFVDTRNSEASGAQTFVQQDETPVARRIFSATETPTAADFFPAATTTRSADRMLYLIYDQSKLCQAENMSCRAFGKPVYSMDRTSIESYENVYYKDDVTKYGAGLCRPSEEFCEEFSYLGAKDYFKDPGEKACEYKDGLSLSAFDFAEDPDVYTLLGGPDFAEGTYSGWFRKGTSIPCYPENLQGGNFFGLPKRGDEPYEGWVGLCKPEHGECTEFRDTNDTSDPQYRTGKPYFFVDNSKLDKTSCSGNVDQGSGCILLRNTNDPTLRYSAMATDLSYQDNGYRAVPPIDCAANPSNPYCAGRCIGKKVTRPVGIGPASEVDYVGTATCDSDADCVFPAEDGGRTTYRVSCVVPRNDANVLVKVNTDRDCAQWLGCRSAETVFDPATSQYKDVCTNLALCDRAGTAENDIFCSNYVDRSQPSIEPVMAEGRYFDVSAYSSRRIGLGEKDYAGYALPNSFQIPDQAMTRVGADGALTVPDATNKYARDYRLAAVAKIRVNLLAGDPGPGGTYPLVTTPAPNDAIVLDDSSLGRANAGLKLCQHVGSGIVGYYRQTDRATATLRSAPKVSFNCYLPVRRESDAYNFQNLAATFGLADPRTDAVLSRAFPSPECRANPEADAPFSAAYVTEWDFSKNPPAPVAKIAGYLNAKTCEYGEDCVCSYKRADYEIPTLTKFFSPFSSAVPTGVCFGGPRNGQSCLPSAVLQTSGGASALIDQGLRAANAEQLCGAPEQGGRCIAASKLEVIRGVFGQCLERDTTRILGEDRSAQPCLTWNPNPILFGDKDPFHYQPTSGYLPPQNSGQYYCVSPSKQPVSFEMKVDSLRRFYQPTDTVFPANLDTYQLTDPGRPGRRNGTDSGQPHSTLINFMRDGQSFDPPRLQSDFQGGAGSQNLDYYELQFDVNQGAPLYAGKMSRMDYGPQWLEDDNRCAPNECDYMSSSLVEAHPINHYPTAGDCRNAYNATNAGARIGDSYPNALRLVDAGNGYTETFFRINDKEFVRKLGANPDLPAEWSKYLSDNLIGFIRANPATGNGGGLLACGYQAAWADNMPPIDYNNADSIRQAERQFRDEFGRNYNPYLTRASEFVLAADRTPISNAIKMRCLRPDAVEEAIEPTEDDCYFKFWETGYKNTQDKRQFDGIFAPGGANTNVVREFNDIRRNAVTARCESSKPYFAIRAMFQSEASLTETGRVSGEPVRANEVKGPWRFVGFWVSSCAGAAGNDQRYIYMNLEVGAANTCTELAEVQSKGSRQDAAFTDRVWSQGGFREQNIGTVYGDAASPFSSAINTRPAGKDPLFQTGQELAGFSRLNPPTFLRSGITTYYTNATYPRDKWAFLSNLFARIYRIYQFRDEPVSRGDKACLQGPFKGTRCTAATGAVDPVCQIDGVCDSTLMSTADLDTIRVCNRGPARGVQCTTEDECKAAAFRGSDNELKPMLRGCVPRSDWTVVGGSPESADARFNPPSSSSLPSNQTRQQAADNGAFQCATGSARAGSRCTIPTGSVGSEGNSPECPTALVGSCRASGSRNVCFFRRSDFDGETDFVLGAGATEVTQVNGRDYGCTSSADCSFTAADFLTATCGAAREVAGVVGRCDGGMKNGQVCVIGDLSQGSPDSCNSSYGDAATEDGVNRSCGPIDSGAGTGYIPVAACQAPSPAVAGPNTSTNADSDNNICTHSGGYVPRLDLCPNPNDEYCGLIAYDMRGSDTDGSVNPTSRHPLPTDITLGHYTPTFLGLPSSGTINAATFSYITYYTPRPPRVAAPDTRNCPVPGQCPISSLDTVSFNGQGDGPVIAGGGQHKSTLHFYAWAAHNQMPLRQVVIDWGDGKLQTIDDTRLKNRKPFCGVQKECSNTPGSSSGLTCQTDSDCPPGEGRCVAVGTCENSPQRTCSADADCTVNGVRDVCRIRTLFGNASDACQQDYFDFSHVYTCGPTEATTLNDCSQSGSAGSVSVGAGQCYFGPIQDGFLMSDVFTAGRPSCTTITDCQTAYNNTLGLLPGSALPADSSCGPAAAAGPTVTTRCSNDPSRTCTPGVPGTCAPGDTCIEGLAPPGGCFDTASNSCRFTPRVMVQDNWGWCTGECRSRLVGGNLEDGADVTIKHPYGGCYVGNVFGGSLNQKIRINDRSSVAEPAAGTTEGQLYVNGNLREAGECSLESGGTSRRPWIVYPGSLQLRRSDELAD